MRSTKVLAAAAAVAVSAMGMSLATAAPLEIDHSLIGHFQHTALPMSFLTGGGTQVTPVAGDTTLFGTSFESTEVPAYTNGQNLATTTNGWSRSGTSATTTINNVGALTGSQDVLWAVGTATTAQFLYRNNGAALWAGRPAGDTVAKQSGSFAIINPAAGTANTGIFAGMQYYNAASQVQAYSIILADPNFASDGVGLTQPYTLETVWDSNGSGGIDGADDGWDYTFGTTSLADLINTYFSMSIWNETTTGNFRFFLGGSELNGAGSGGGGIAPLATTGPSLLVNYQARLAAGGTVPRFREDDFSLVSNTIVPEPTSIGLLSLGAVGLIARRRRQA